ncbi:MAG: 30S ribosomal protein S12 methylthiotransferase RimO [Clostridia bacterium]|nr:30S ribosomal protein S12 methylthiotransferase RimO [Clostridia bacterium]
MIKVGMVSLGCPKNRVDAEIMLKKLQDAGCEITPEEAEADVIIVNTCGFIEDAKAEAIENILEAANYKKDGKCKALIVTGCLAERYRDEIKEQLPEVDVTVGLAGNNDIVEIVQKAYEGSFSNRYGKKEDLIIDGDRLLTTPPYTAYVKIAEGCDNCCTYCAIPKIRGRFRSRQMVDILFEIGNLVEQGVKEVILVAQDTTRYGEDIYGTPQLTVLLKNICKIEDLKWVRMLYTYPERISDELLDLMASEEKIVNYLDIPLQHCDGTVLKRMNRRGDRETLEALINKIRTKIPDITLRTTLITGFPGETEEQFESLCDFVKEMRFDRLGCFAYSEEEDTVAATYEDQIEQQTRVDRAEIIMNDQLLISSEKNTEKYGTVQEVLIEGYDDYIKCYFGRTRADAPEIDGKVFFTVTEPQVIGTFVKVRINDSLEYDLLGEMEEEGE